MNTRPLNKVLLIQGADIVTVSPSMTDILPLMELIKSENGRPDFVLTFDDSVGPDAPSKHKLYVMLAFHSGTLPPRWLINYGIKNSRESGMRLAIQPPTRTHLETWTCCGLVSKYRADCLVTDDEIVRDAIEWFLKCHLASPTLDWVPYYDSVFRPDGSRYDNWP